MKTTTKILTIAAALTLHFTLFTFHCFAQNVGINTTGATPNSKALLDVSGTTGGLLIPRMTTTDRNALAPAATENSLLIFNTTTQCFEFWNAPTSTWITLGCGCTALPSAPTANAASGITPIAFTANWTAVAGATTYYLDVSTVSNFATFVPGYFNHNVGNVTTFNVPDLTCGTTYYYRVRVQTNCGTSANSNTITVTTSACAPSCGTQVFASANLDVGTIMVNSPPAGQQQFNNGIVEKYCYNNTAANCPIYGGLYEWGEAMNYAASINCDPCGSGGVQGICPAGFHIPTDLEWSRYEWCIENTIAPTGSTLLSTFQNNTGWRGTNSNAGPGAKMKATSSNSPAWNGTNASGFNALPAGYRNYGDGSFGSLGTNAYFWSATEAASGTNAWSRFLNTGSGQSGRFNDRKTNGFSVRCLQN